MSHWNTVSVSIDLSLWSSDYDVLLCLSIITKKHIILLSLTSCQSISKTKAETKNIIATLILNSWIMKFYSLLIIKCDIIWIYLTSFPIKIFLIHVHCVISLQNQEHIYRLFMTINLQFSTRRALLAPILFLPIAFILLDEPWYPALLPFLSFLCLSATSSSSLSRLSSRCLKRRISAF